MNSQISQISEIIEDIKEKISDNEYKIIMDNLMKIHNNNNKGGADQPRLLSRPSLFGNYVPRSHHEGAACINLRS